MGLLDLTFWLVLLLKNEPLQFILFMSYRISTSIVHPQP